MVNATIRIFAIFIQPLKIYEINDSMTTKITRVIIKLTKGLHKISENIKYFMIDQTAD